MRSILRRRRRQVSNQAGRFLDPLESRTLLSASVASAASIPQNDVAISSVDVTLNSVIAYQNVSAVASATVVVTGSGPIKGTWELMTPKGIVTGSSFTAKAVNGVVVIPTGKLITSAVGNCSIYLHLLTGPGGMVTDSDAVNYNVVPIPSASVSSVTITSSNAGTLYPKDIYSATPLIGNATIGAAGFGNVSCTWMVTSPNGKTTKVGGSSTAKIGNGNFTVKTLTGLPKTTVGNYTFWLHVVDANKVAFDSNVLGYSVVAVPPVSLSSVTISTSETTVFPKNAFSFTPFTANATIDASGFGNVSCSWLVTSPNGKTTKVGGSFTVTIKNGSFTVKPFTGLPNTTIGNYSVMLQVVGPNKTVMNSNAVNYGVVAIPPLVITSIDAFPINPNPVIPNGPQGIDASFNGTGDGLVNCTWMVMDPQGKTVSVGKTFTVIIVNGTNPRSLLTNLPDTMVGDYKVWLHTVAVTSKAVVDSAPQTYTVDMETLAISGAMNTAADGNGSITGVTRKDLANDKVVVYGFDGLGWWNQNDATVDSTMSWWNWTSTSSNPDQFWRFTVCLLPKAVATPVVLGDSALPSVLDQYPSVFSQV